MKSSRSTFLAAAALAMASAGMGAIATSSAVPGIDAKTAGHSDARGSRTAERQQPSQDQRGARSMVDIFGELTRIHRNARGRRFPNGPGWTYRQVQRMAKKRRNQARNRKAHR